MFSSFEEVSFDYWIVSAKICMSLRRNKKQTIKTTSYDWFTLTNWDTSSQYTATVRNKFDALQETSKRHTRDDEYENFVTAHIEAVSESIPTKPKAKYRVPWESIAKKNKIKQDNVKKVYLQPPPKKKYQRAET